MDAQFWTPTVNHHGQYLDVYSSMLADGIIFVNAPINQRIAGLVTSSLLHINSNTDTAKKPKIYLNTRKGDIVSALSIVDIIEFYKSKNIQIQTIGFGEVGIAAALILAAGTKGFRKLAKHAQVSLYLGLDSLDFEVIKSTQAQERQETKLRKKSNELFAQYTGQDISVFRNLTGAEKYLDAKEVKGIGLIDDFI